MENLGFKNSSDFQIRMQNLCVSVDPEVSAYMNTQDQTEYLSPCHTIHNNEKTSRDRPQTWSHFSMSAVPWLAFYTLAASWLLSCPTSASSTELKLQQGREVCPGEALLIARWGTLRLANFRYWNSVGCLFPSKKAEWILETDAFAMGLRTACELLPKTQ